MGVKREKDEARVTTHGGSARLQGRGEVTQSGKFANYVAPVGGFSSSRENSREDFLDCLTVNYREKCYFAVVSSSCVGKCKLVDV